MARRHNINSNILFGWRKQYREGVLGPLVSGVKDGFVPVAVIGDEGDVLPVAPVGKNSGKTPLPSLSLPAPKPVTTFQSPEPQAIPAGSIELQLCGRIKLRVEGHVDQNMLRNVLLAAREFT